MKNAVVEYKRKSGKRGLCRVCCKGETGVIYGGWEGCENQEGFEANGNVEGRAA